MADNAASPVTDVNDVNVERIVADLSRQFDRDPQQRFQHWLRLRDAVNHQIARLALEAASYARTPRP